MKGESKKLKRPSCARCERELVIAEDLPHDVNVSSVTGELSNLDADEWREADINFCIICVEELTYSPEAQ